MTSLEKQAVAKMLKLKQSPSVPFKLVKKLDSEDFKLGWSMAHQSISEILDFIQAAKPSELRRYIGSPEK